MPIVISEQREQLRQSVEALVAELDHREPRARSKPCRILGGQRSIKRILRENNPFVELPLGRQPIALDLRVDSEQIPLTVIYVGYSRTTNEIIVAGEVVFEDDRPTKEVRDGLDVLVVAKIAHRFEVRLKADTLEGIITYDRTGDPGQLVTVMATHAELLKA